MTLDTVHLIKTNKPIAKRIDEMREDSKLTKKPEEAVKGRLASGSLTSYIMTQIHKLQYANTCNIAVIVMLIPRKHYLNMQISLRPILNG